MTSSEQKRLLAEQLLAELEEQRALDAKAYMEVERRLQVSGVRVVSGANFYSLVSLI